MENTKLIRKDADYLIVKLLEEKLNIDEYWEMSITLWLKYRALIKFWHKGPGSERMMCTISNNNYQGLKLHAESDYYGDHENAFIHALIEFFRTKDIEILKKNTTNNQVDHNTY